MSALSDEVLAEISAAPDSMLYELIDYIKFLKFKNSSKDSTIQHKRQAGIAKDPNFYMAEDFDAPLEDFKEYM